MSAHRIEPDTGRRHSIPPYNEPRARDNSADFDELPVAVPV
jgi:hypothetical protein